MSRYIQDVELTYILLCRERSCNCFIYVYICVYIYQNSCFKLISFLRSFDMNTNNFQSEPFTFLKHFFFYSVCEPKHETNFVYVTKNRDLSISLIIQLPKVCLTIRNTSKKHSNYQKGTNTTYNCSKCDHAPSIF